MTHQVTSYDQKSVVRTFMLTKHKVDSQNRYLKTKSRLCANGKFQSPDTYKDSDLSSPTVSSTTVKTLFGISAFRNYTDAVLDVSNAFLNAPLKERVIVYFHKQLAQRLVQLKPEYKQFLNKQGGMHLRLRKALYGLVQSPSAWYEVLSKVIMKAGFKKSIHDPCLFIGQDIYISVHVDDMYICAKNKRHIVALHRSLLQAFTNVSLIIADQFDYLGMQVTHDRSNHCMHINQHGYIEKILSKYKIKDQHAVTPATASLFIDEYTLSDPSEEETLEGYTDESLDELDNTTFLSMVMSLSFLTHTRPDIHVGVNYLSTRSIKPSKHDWRKLFRIYHYINSTKSLSLKLKPKSLDIHCYVDASWNSYPGYIGLSGTMISLGPCDEASGCTVYASSKKQKLITRSSCESELVAIYDSMEEILFVRNIFTEITGNTAPATLYQDNQSTITIAEQGPKARTRHIDRRYFYIREVIAEKKIVLKKEDTNTMIADMFTKPIVGKRFRSLRSCLLHNNCN